MKICLTTKILFVVVFDVFRVIAESHGSTFWKRSLALSDNLVKVLIFLMSLCNSKISSPTRSCLVRFAGSVVNTSPMYLKLPQMWKLIVLRVWALNNFVFGASACWSGATWKWFCVDRVALNRFSLRLLETPQILPLRSKSWPWIIPIIGLLK